MPGQDGQKKEKNKPTDSIDVLSGLLVLLLIFFAPFMTKGDQVPTAVTVSLVICGNDVLEEGEECDGAELDGATCSSLGYDQGTLTCSINCQYDTSQCSNVASGGGGGGGDNTVYVPQTGVSFSGRAYPGSEVFLLKDASLAGSTTAGPDAAYEIKLEDLSAGNYVFSIYAEDYQGYRSKLQSFPVSVTEGATTHVSGMFIAPTLGVDKANYMPGETMIVYGQASPKSNISIVVNSDEPHYLQATSDDGGVYLYEFDTSLLEVGEHFAKSRASYESSISEYSETVAFVVGQAVAPPATGPISYTKGDLNGDHLVNLVDFSIAGYWYKNALSAKLKDIESQALNGDGVIDLRDLSIMAYHWTG